MAEEVLAGQAGQVEVDLLEVIGAVVARNAAQVQAQQRLAVRDRELVDRVRAVDQVVGVRLVGVVLGFDEIAREVQRSGRGVAALAPLGQQVGHDVGVRAVEGEPFVHPEAEQVLAVTHALAGPEEILEIVGPALDELLAVNKLVDQAVALVRIPVRLEGQHFLERGDAPHQVKIGAAQELAVGCQPGVRHPIPLDLGKDRLVDKVPSRNCVRRCGHRPQRTGLRRHRFSDFGCLRRWLLERPVGMVGTRGRFWREVLPSLGCGPERSRQRQRRCWRQSLGRTGHAWLRDRFSVCHASLPTVVPARGARPCRTPHQRPPARR